LNNLQNSLFQVLSLLDLRRRRQIVLFIVLAFFGSFAEIIGIGAAIPFLAALSEPTLVWNHTYARFFLDKMGQVELEQLPLIMTVLFALLATLSAGMRWVVLYCQSKLAHSIGIDLSLRIFRRALHRPYAEFTAASSNEVIASVTSKADYVVYSVLVPYFALLVNGILFFVAVLVLTFANPVVSGLVFSCLGLLYGIIGFISNKRLLANGVILNREGTRVVKITQESLGGIRDIIIDGVQEEYCKIFGRADSARRHALASNQILSAAPRFLIETIMLLLFTGFSFYIFSGTARVSAVLPLLGALAIGAQRLLPTIQTVYTSWVSIRSSQETLNYVLRFVGQPIREVDVISESGNIAFEQEISVRNLTFSYTASDTPVFSGLDFSIRKGSRIGIIGDTGSGKSTLLDLLMGLMFATSGEVLIDGVRLDSSTVPGWHRLLSHVPQSVFLADASVSENIAFGINNDRVSVERLNWAVEIAQLSDTLAGWVAGYSTVVGERGARLSGGERQRIGIARALYRESQVLVLDEATSALDSATESRIIDKLEFLTPDMTVIMVAHRLSTLRHCDQIIELKSGRISFRGTYDDLVIRESVGYLEQ